MSQINTVIHTSYVRACAAVYKRHGAEMEESVRDEIWEEMVSDMSDVRQTVSIPTIGSTAGSVADDEKEDTKLSPLQRLEKQAQTLAVKIDTIRSRQQTMKQTIKQKEKDPEDLKKFTAKLAEIDAKLHKLADKPAKKHMEKWTPTWTKHYKAAGGKDDEQAAFQEYVNAQSDAEFKKSSFAEHAKAYINRPVPKVVQAVEDVDEDVVQVNYDGEDFTVGELTQSVYRVTERGDVPVEDIDLIVAVLKKYRQLY